MNPTDGAQFPVAETAAPADLQLAPVNAGLESTAAPLVDGIGPAPLTTELPQTVPSDQPAEAVPSGAPVSPVNEASLPPLPEQVSPYQAITASETATTVAPPEAVPSVTIVPEVAVTATLEQAQPVPAVPTPAQTPEVPLEVVAPVSAVPVVPVSPQAKTKPVKGARSRSLTDVEQVDALVRMKQKEAWTVLETKVLGADVGSDA